MKQNSVSRSMTVPCPCGTGKRYCVCCRPFHSGASLPPTAEKLMRSRYSAFALMDAQYLIRTWHRSTRPAELELHRRQRWLELQIVATSGGTMLANTGTVEFVATYEERGRPGQIREISNFVREEGSWFYVDGAHPSAG